jgi:hypothetical protein
MIHRFMFAPSGRAPFVASNPNISLPKISGIAIQSRMSIGARPAQGSMPLGVIAFGGIPEDIPGTSRH